MGACVRVCVRDSGVYRGGLWNPCRVGCDSCAVLVLSMPYCTGHIHYAYVVAHSGFLCTC